MDPCQEARIRTSTSVGRAMSVFEDVDMVWLNVQVEHITPYATTVFPMDIAAVAGRSAVVHES